MLAFRLECLKQGQCVIVFLQLEPSQCRGSIAFAIYNRQTFY